MAPKQSLLEQMRANPKGDWTVEDVEKLCREHGLSLLKPNGGSHYHMHSDHMTEMQCVPYKRRIKPIYIRKAVAMVERHNAAAAAKAATKKGERG